MIDPTVPVPLFSFAQRYEWVECTQEGLESLQVEVRKSLTNRERLALQNRVEEIAKQRKTISEQQRGGIAELEAEREQATKASDATALQDVTERLAALIDECNQAYRVNDRQLEELIAPYVRNWNAAIEGKGGKLVKVKPPMEIGADAFLDVDRLATEWMVSAILTAFRSGNGFASLKPSAEKLAEPSNASSPQTESEVPAELPIAS